MIKRISVVAILIVILCVAVLKGLFPGDKKDYREMVELGIRYQDQGENKKALKFFRDAAKAYPDYPQAHFFLGRLYSMMQKEDDAVVEFTSFMEKMKTPSQAMVMDAKGYIKCLNAITDICSDLKRYDLMKDAIAEVIALDPKDQGAYYNLGVYYYNAEHSRPKAYQNFKKAADLDPNTATGKKAKYAIEFMRNNPDSRVAPDLSFINQEYR
jgi:tetratricopeptide (TPR) repeat protein